MDNNEKKESIQNLDNTVIRHFRVSLSKNMDSKSDKPIKMESKNSKKRNKYKKCDPIGAAFQMSLDPSLTLRACPELVEGMTQAGNFTRTFKHQKCRDINLDIFLFARRV